jgi:Zn-dependent protease with chaperone function
MSQSSEPNANLSPLVHPKERLYFAVALALSIFIYVILILAALGSAELRSTILTYAVLIGLGSMLLHGFMLGHIRANGVFISANQFPWLYECVRRNSATLNMHPPDVFLVQSGGLLNAFATRFLGRNFVILYSDVLAMAEEKGEEAVSFVVGHELAHHKRGHLRYRWLIFPGRMIPFLGSAYSRACEYTCDRYGALCAPQGGVKGLLALAAGPQLYHKVDARLFATQASTEGGFWTALSEMVSSHPHLSKRVGALLRVTPEIPAYSPIRSIQDSTPVSV